jgi:urease accessory protein
MTRLTLAAAAALIAEPALAHTGQGTASGFLHGLAHPVSGLDHLLAMVAVGLWSGLVLPGRVWAGPAAFMAAMALGAGLAWAGIGLPLVETSIALSVVVLGLLALAARRGQRAVLTQASLAAVALFALGHGHAHGTEATGHAAAYLAGFLLATALLHGAGLLLARAVAGSRSAQQALGAAIAGSGLWLALG